MNDSECLKWCLVSYLHPADHHPARIGKADKDVARELNFKNIKFQVKIRNIHEIEKKNCIDISVFSYENKQKYPICVSKNGLKKNVLIYCR